MQVTRIKKEDLAANVTGIPILFVHKMIIIYKHIMLP